jgi:uncharacterized protein (TIGR00251 family)
MTGRAPPRPKAATAGPVRIAVRVKPRSRQSKVLGVREGVLEVAVAAAPVDGEANRELVAVIARHFGLPKSSVTILVGASGRNKWVGLRDIDPGRLATCLGGDKSR